MSKKNQISELSWHEATDRSMLAFEFFLERVVDHPAVRSSQKLRKQSEAISRKLSAFSQAVVKAAISSEQ